MQDNYKREVRELLEPMLAEMKRRGVPMEAISAALFGAALGVWDGMGRGRDEFMLMTAGIIESAQSD